MTFADSCWNQSNPTRGPPQHPQRLEEHAVSQQTQVSQGPEESFSEIASPLPRRLWSPDFEGDTGLPIDAGSTGIGDSGAAQQSSVTTQQARSPFILDNAAPQRQLPPPSDPRTAMYTDFWRGADQTPAITHVTGSHSEGGFRVQSPFEIMMEQRGLLPVGRGAGSQPSPGGPGPWYSSPRPPRGYMGGGGLARREGYPTFMLFNPNLSMAQNQEALRSGACRSLNPEIRESYAQMLRAIDLIGVDHETSEPRSPSSLTPAMILAASRSSLPRSSLSEDEGNSDAGDDEENDRDDSSIAADQQVDLITPEGTLVPVPEGFNPMDGMIRYRPITFSDGRAGTVMYQLFEDLEGTNGVRAVPYVWDPLSLTIETLALDDPRAHYQEFNDSIRSRLMANYNRAMIVTQHTAYIPFSEWVRGSAMHIHGQRNPDEDELWPDNHESHEQPPPSYGDIGEGPPRYDAPPDYSQ